MKFKKLLLLLFPLMISLLPSCSKDIDQAIIERKENIKTTVEIKDAKELNKMITNEQSFIVFRTTNQFKQYATQQRLIKEFLMLNYITTLWEALHR